MKIREIIWKQSQQIEKLKDKLQKQAEWIENNKNKAKNCAMQMQNQGKEIQRLKQSNKDLMAVIWKTKRERANKGREVCKANNEIVQYKKRIAELEKQLAITEKAFELACEKVKYFEEMQDREMGHFEFFGYENEYDLQAIIEQYKQQAKEMLENEKRR